MTDEQRPLTPEELDNLEFFGDPAPVEPPRKKHKPKRTSRMIDDIFVERVLTGEPVMSINRDLGRHPTSGPPTTEYYRKRLAERQKKLIKKEEITTDRVIHELAKMAFMDPRAFFDDEGKPIPVQMLDDDTAAGLAGIEVHKLGKEQQWAEVVKIRLADKRSALETLGKSLNLFAKDNERNLNVNMQVSDTERARRVAFMLQEAMRARENTDKTGE